MISAPLWLDLSKASKMFSISVTGLRELAHKGEIPFNQIGIRVSKGYGKIRFKTKDLLDYFESHKVSTTNVNNV